MKAIRPADLIAAGAANHRSFFAAQARAVGGVVEDRFGGVLAYLRNGDATIGFPSLPEESEAPFADETLATLRAAGITEAGWWLLDNARTSSLGPRLVARGFDWGWRPNWMALDLARSPLVEDHPLPADVTIEPVAEPPAEASRLFRAYQNGDLVGRITVHVCEVGDIPVGGIYDTSVEDSRRRQGIGTALTVAAVRELHALGCRAVLLNATGMGEPVYRRAGFDLLGESGQTWWIGGHRLAAAGPPEEEVAFAEAIGYADLEAAAALLRATPRDLDAPLACEEPPIGVAVVTGQEASVRWLLDRGASLDVMSGWRLGWYDRTIDALKRQPGLANRRTGGMGFTPLHHAVVTGDTQLARVVLAAGADLSVDDARFHGTALDWARRVGNVELVRLISEAATSPN